MEWSITSEKETVLSGSWVFLRINTSDKCTQNINAVVINTVWLKYVHQLTIVNGKFFEQYEVNN